VSLAAHLSILRPPPLPHESSDDVIATVSDPLRPLRRDRSPLTIGGGVWIAPGFLTAISIQHTGYQDPPGLPPLRGPMFHIPNGSGWREVLIDGDTRFDIQLVRR
jgi:hypothetical protein